MFPFTDLWSFLVAFLLVFSSVIIMKHIYFSLKKPMCYIVTLCSFVMIEFLPCKKIICWHSVVTVVTLSVKIYACVHVCIFSEATLESLHDLFHFRCCYFASLSLLPDSLCFSLSFFFSFFLCALFLPPAAAGLMIVLRLSIDKDIDRYQRPENIRLLHWKTFMLLISPIDS